MLRTAHPQSTCAARYASYTEKNWLPPHSVARYISPSMENNSAVPAPAARQIRLTTDVSGFPNAENGTITSVAAKTIPMIP